jgi:mannan endo-1,4-beta-mannosidase
MSDSAGQGLAGRNLYAPVDPDLCVGGIELLNRLRHIRGRFALFGHQQDEGTRRSPDFPSDVLEATGTYPAVFGFDLGGIERSEPDREHFMRMRQWIRDDYRRGGIITLSWHSANPLTGGGYGENLAPGSVSAVLPGGARHDVWCGWLDRVSEFMLSLRDDDGDLIPVVFRPFHEHNGDWFWWCIGGRDDNLADAAELQRAQSRDGHEGQFGPDADASDSQFADLWRCTVRYLRDKREVHNLVYAISPDRSRIRLDRALFATDYLRGYPGDEFVDVLGLDDYIDIGRNDNPGTYEQILGGFTLSLEELARVAGAHGKPAAMTEVGTPNGMAGVPERPWTDFLDAGANSSELSRRVLWYLTWTNSWHGEPNVYGTPLSTDPTGADFKRFAEIGYIRLLDRAL